MVYTVKQVADLSGVSSRTLRYYDEIHLLKPAEISESGYRLYQQQEIDRLQQILIYRSMGLSLKEIKKLLDHPDFKIETALRHQQKQLMKRRDEIDELLALVEQTLADYEGEERMNNEEKFQLFKQQKWQENETLYGEEMQEKYGEKTIQQAKKKWTSLSQAELDERDKTEQELLVKLKQYGLAPKLPSELAQEIFLLHKKWLSYSWQKYSREAHQSVAEMYVLDERFTAYYEERAGKDAAGWLNDIIQFYA
ncbi:MerR family transcriptional regulator [Enterococcus sp. AZ109]|uniref:MerR family transcriptional regulator n=1 Tax=Enterococcus sp. AZ109 TaxID=2774634 RepID=UPI003F27311C